MDGGVLRTVKSEGSESTCDSNCMKFSGVSHLRSTPKYLQNEVLSFRNRCLRYTEYDVFRLVNVQGLLEGLTPKTKSKDPQYILWSLEWAPNLKSSQTPFFRQMYTLRVAFLCQKNCNEAFRYGSYTARPQCKA